MVYQTPSEIKDRVEYEAEDFYSNKPQPEDKFEDLLERLEVESRSFIESNKGDISFSEETVTQEFNAPESKVIQLEYPVTNVVSVDYRRYPEGDFNTLEEGNYKYTDHNLILIRFPKQFLTKYGATRGSQNPLTSKLRRYEWNDFATTIKVEYERGFDPVPGNVKGIQITLINKKLRQLREEQNIASLNIGEIDNLGSFDDLMTEDVEKRLNDITSFKNHVFTV